MAGTAREIRVDGTPTNGANPWIDSLVWGGAWADAAGQPTSGGAVTISYDLRSGFDPFQSFNGASLAWDAASVAAVERALASWAAVAQVEFVRTASAAADVHVWLNTNAQSQQSLGYSEVPGFSTGEPLYTNFNGGDPSWTAGGLAPGGFALITLIHEFGHLLGLAHPHDGGEAADGNRFPGVSRPFGDYGDFNLNQGIFTLMSYNDGWEARFPSHAANDFGWTATPMALDIAAIQAIYGANMSHATGNDTYVLPTKNDLGTFWSCIWDAGGIDRISNEGKAADCEIDLAAATLTGPNAGGAISHALGIIGGFTIANGVVIENATGGLGDDLLRGNGVANTLAGGGGRDTMIGGEGGDVYITDGGDRIIEAAGQGRDVVRSSGNMSLAANVETLVLTGTRGIDGTGGATANRIVGNGGDNTLNGLGGKDTLVGGQGADAFQFNRGIAPSNVDRITDFQPVADTIQLDNAVFDGLKRGWLDAQAFALNATGDATDSRDRIIYETDTGRLWFDEDGKGGQRAEHFATIDPNLGGQNGVSHLDFFVF